MTASVLQERQVAVSAASGTAVLAFASNVTAGSAIHAIGTDGQASTVTYAWSDNNSGVWTNRERAWDSTNTGLGHGTSVNHPGGATTVTLTFSTSSAFNGLWIREIGGVTTTAVDGHNATAGLSSSTTNSTQPALISTVCMDGNAGGAPVPSGGLTGDVADWSGFGFGNLAESAHQRITTTGTQTATFTTHGSSVVIAIFDESGGAAVAPFTPTDLDERVTTKILASDFAPPNLLADQVLKLPPFVQKELPGWLTPRWSATDFNPPNLLTDQILKAPPITQTDLLYKIQWKGVYTDFNPPNLLAQQTLKLPPFTQEELPGWPIRARGVFTDFSPPTLPLSTLLPTPAPVLPQDLSQQVKAKWAATDFTAPNLLSLTLTAAPAPLLPQDLAQAFKARWAGSDYLQPNLLTGLLPSPPIAPVDATIAIRAKGVFTDFSPPNLTLSTLIPLAPARPQDISGIRLEYRWVRGDDIPINLPLLRLATVTPIAPQDLSGIRLDARTSGSDFSPPNLTLFLPVPPPPPPSTGAGRHGTRAQARRRRQLDVLRAKMEAFREQRKEADLALIAAEDGEIKARAKLLKRVKVKPLTKKIEQYAPVRKAIEKHTVATERHRSILEQIRWHQLEAERIEREIAAEESAREDEEAALTLMHYLMMESWA